MGYTTSPLRYPGGKTRLSNFIKQIILDNDLLDGDYVEVYAGGAGIAWSLLFDGYVDTVHINDINKAVFSFWFSVFNQTDDLCRLIKDTPVTMETWHQQKSIQSNSANSSSLELGFSTFFLNRTNRSGIIWAGVIGGKNQEGNYKLDARYNKANLIGRIEKIALYRNHVNIYALDAIKFIKSVLPNISERSLLYLDPPYYQKGAGLYEHHYVHDDHVAVAKAMLDVKQKWIISYDNTPEVQGIYNGYKNTIYQISYSTAKRYSGSEIIFFSPNMNILNHESPLLFKEPQKRELQSSIKPLR